MLRRKTWSFLLGALAAGSLLAGCGGGGGGEASSLGQAPSPSGPVTVLAWTPPSTYNDNAAMDPYQDLDYYELYVRTDRNFTDNDLPVAQVAAVADTPTPDGRSVERTLVSEFPLELLQDLPARNRLYVSMKAVGTDRQKSAFMPPVAWDRI